MKKNFFLIQVEKKSVTSISEMLTEIHSAKDQSHSTHFTTWAKCIWQKQQSFNKHGPLVEILKCLSGTTATINHLTLEIITLTNVACILIANSISWLNVKFLITWRKLVIQIFTTTPYNIPRISGDLITSTRKCERCVFDAVGGKKSFFKKRQQSPIPGLTKLDFSKIINAL